VSGFLERKFGIAAAGSTVQREIVGGAVTFLTLSYILFVQPQVMAAAGIDPTTALFATCFGSAFACVAMAWIANYPIALAPAMGHNFFFAFTACGAIAMGGMGLTWQQALAANLLAGLAFVLLSAFRVREAVIRALPPALKHAIAGGIGLLIALLGFEWGGLVRASPATLVQLGDLSSPAAKTTLIGLGVLAVLAARRVPGAALWTIGVTLCVGVGFGVARWPAAAVATEFVPSVALTQLDFGGLFASSHAFEVVLTFFFLMLFDTIGTLVGVGARAGLLRNGELPRAGNALFADACGTVVGAGLGTSTITSYVESAAGVAAGARTGFASLVTAALLVLAWFFHPALAAVGASVVSDGGVALHPVLAPVLIHVGALMSKSLAEIDWDDPTLALPAFLTLVTIPLTLSITDGIAIGCVSAAWIALCAGKARERHPLLYALAVVFVLTQVLG
jgi:AGZA family xanthine/uracil permease-like MFS transporter